VLVRCFKSHPFELLEPDLQGYAASQMGVERPTPAMRCMTLLASVGDKPEWCSRHTSQRFRCTPLSQDTLSRTAIRTAMWTAMWGNLFVPYRIASVLGFGGQLRRGDVYAVRIFSRVPISREVATQVNALALDVTSAFFPFGDDWAYDRNAN
jgi:hypothetical protein